MLLGGLCKDLTEIIDVFWFRSIKLQTLQILHAIFPHYFLPYPFQLCP